MGKNAKYDRCWTSWWQISALVWYCLAACTDQNSWHSLPDGWPRCLPHAAAACFFLLLLYGSVLREHIYMYLPCGFLSWAKVINISPLAGSPKAWPAIRADQHQGMWLRLSGEGETAPQASVQQEWWRGRFCKAILGALNQRQSNELLSDNMLS